MKKICILIPLTALAIASYGQVQGKQVNAIPRAEAVSKSIGVAKEGTVSSYEKTIVAGKLTLIKSYEKGDGQLFETFYSLVKYNDASFNNRKPVRISLTRKSYDSVFTKSSEEMLGRYPVLNKYVTDQKISLSDEKGWIALIRYYNDL